MSTHVPSAPILSASEIRYMKKILAAHIIKLDEATLFDEDLQKKNVDFSKQILKKMDSLEEMRDKAFYLQLPGENGASIMVDEINLSTNGESVGRLFLK
jgi:hypothetical protein